ncbi:MAG TPA: AAA family ATPase [Novosphingobium sp.]|nr:AAA family ATPase [Novosphingobium sp.]
MQRVLVIGSPGAGKSTLAHAIAQRTGLPLHHLDRMHWLPGWIERDRAEALERVKAVLVEERWIIDGNYGSTLPVRIPRADTVVWLDYPTHLCLWRVLKRWWQYRGTARPDMTEGCPENLNAEFLLYVLMFRHNWSARNGAAMAAFSGTLLRFTHPRQTQAWLDRLGTAEGAA